MYRIAQYYKSQDSLRWGAVGGFVRENGEWRSGSRWREWGKDSRDKVLFSEPGRLYGDGKILFVRPRNKADCWSCWPAVYDSGFTGKRRCGGIGDSSQSWSGLCWFPYIYWKDARLLAGDMGNRHSQRETGQSGFYLSGGIGGAGAGEHLLSDLYSSEDNFVRYVFFSTGVGCCLYFNQRTHVSRRFVRGGWSGISYIQNRRNEGCHKERAVSGLFLSIYI